MQTYLTALAEYTGPAATFDEAWLAYIGPARYQSDMQPVDRCKAVIRRTAAAVDDLDPFGAFGL